MHFLVTEAWEVLQLGIIVSWSVSNGTVLTITSNSNIIDSVTLLIYILCVSLVDTNVNERSCAFLSVV